MTHVHPLDVSTLFVNRESLTSGCDLLRRRSLVVREFSSISVGSRPSFVRTGVAGGDLDFTVLEGVTEIFRSRVVDSVVKPTFVTPSSWVASGNVELQIKTYGARRYQQKPRRN